MEKKEKKKRKPVGGKRLVRIIILALVAFLTVSLGRALMGQKENVPTQNLPLKAAFETLGLRVLGAAVKYLPEAPKIEEVNLGSKTTIDGQGIEPIQQPTEEIKEQTEDLLEMIRNLPQDQIEAIKKQIYKDFCQKLLKEE